jgi:hypothetical protein
VVNLDAITTVPAAVLLERICRLSFERMFQVDRAIHLALGIDLPCRVSG